MRPRSYWLTLAHAACPACPDPAAAVSCWLTPPALPPALPPLQCSPSADLNNEFNTSIDINGAPWEAAVLIGFLVLGRIAVYIALRKKTQR